MQKVACDICGQDYNILPERLGDWLECKMCQCEFEVVQHNFVVEKEQQRLSWNELWESDSVVLVRRIVRGVLILVVMGALASLFFIDPPARVNYFTSERTLPVDGNGETV